MLRYILSILTLAGAFLLGFHATAFAASATDPGSSSPSLIDLAKPVLDAVMHGQAWLAAALGLVFLTAAIGRYGDKIPGVGGTIAKFDASDAGRATLLLIATFGGAVATALVAGGPGAVMSLALAWAALKVAIGAAGIYSIAKKLLEPLASKAPSWMQPVFSLVFWFLDRKAVDPVKEAETAGVDAVKASPSTGADGVAGKSRDVA